MVPNTAAGANTTTNTTTNTNTDTNTHTNTNTNTYTNTHTTSQAACAELATLSVALPSCRPLPPGKLTSVLSARQANAPFFGELRANLHALNAALQAPIPPDFPPAARPPLHPPPPPTTC